MPTNTELSVGTPEEQMALSNLLTRLKPYENHPLGNILLTRANRDFSNGSIHIGERLVEFGVYLVHSSINSNDGVISAEKRDGIYLISPDYHDETFFS